MMNLPYISFINSQKKQMYNIFYTHRNRIHLTGFCVNAIAKMYNPAWHTLYNQLHIFVHLSMFET